MNTYLDKVKKYYPFTLLESRNIIITILIIGFMYGFDDGSNKWNLANWSYNLLVSIGIAAISILVFVSGQKLGGLMSGFRTEFQMWWPGLIVALIITFISRGWLWIPVIGGMTIHHMAGHRLGFFRYGTNMLDNGVIASLGPVASVVFATILKQIANIIGPASAIPIIDKIYWFSLVIALVNMVPIPPLAGSKLIYTSRLPYVFIFSFIIVYTLIVFVFNYYSWILGLIGAGVIWLAYYIKIESKKY